MLPFSAMADSELRIGITQYPSTLHPMIDSMLAKTYVNAMVRRPLTIHDPNWQPVCMLCTELPSFENGRATYVDLPDGTKTIRARYTIRPDAVWADGVPITTDDILFSWAVGKNENVGISNFELYAKDIVDIENLDDKNFAITFEKEKCDFALISDFNVLPQHVEADVFKQSPAEYKNTNHFDSNPTTLGLFYGPYVISQVKTGQGFVLTRNPRWWGKPPAFDRIRIIVIENSGALSAQLLAGQVDMIAGELGLALDQALSFERRVNRARPGEYQIIYKPGLVYEHIDINQDNPHLQDVRVRQALLYGINRKGISQFLFDGKQPVADSTVNPLDDIYDEDVKTYAYSVEMAENLLDAAGWGKRNDGWRYNDEGVRLEITQMTTAGNKARELVQQAIQSDWSKIGVYSTILNQAPRVFFGETTRTRQYPDTAMYAWLSAPRNIPRTTLHSSMVPTTENNYAGQNYPGFKNARMDEILDDLETVCEDNQNRALWAELQAIYATELPALPLFFRSEVHVLPHWLQGVQPSGHQYPSTYWIENWSDAR